MATYVLVHGAWHGSWCWARVRKLLQAEGHAVFTPTLTGLGERSHLLSKSVRLQTHIDDVVNLIRWEDLNDVILCGHSYAGIVMTGVAEAVAERIVTMIYLDAFVPTSGQSLLDLLPPETAAALCAGARSKEDGWRLPPRTAASFAVNDGDREWVDRQCTPHPFATFEDPVRFTDRVRSIVDVRYILATENPGSPFVGLAESARKRGWQVVRIAAGHDVMLDDPKRLVELLR
jgi:pimeloyl-ACP methyl ester carboxylesterase